MFTSYYVQAAFYFLLAAGILASNVVVAVVVFVGGLWRKRSFLLLINFAAVDTISAICLLLIAASVVAPANFLHDDGLLAFNVAASTVTSAAQIILVVINVSYVLETRKEHKRLDSSRLLTVAMMASPWVYALLIVTPLYVSTFDSVQTGNDVASRTNLVIGLQLLASIIPGFFALIATTLSLVSYVTRDRVCDQRGNELSLTGRDATSLHTFGPAQRGSNSDQLPVVTSTNGTSPGDADGVMAETRSPKAEVAYTALASGVMQLTYYMLFSPLFLAFDTKAEQNSFVAAAIISYLRPAAFSWLWLLRPDYKQAFKRALHCGTSSVPYESQT